VCRDTAAAVAKAVELCQRTRAELNAAEAELDRLEQLERKQLHQRVEAIRGNGDVSELDDFAASSRARIATRISAAEATVAVFDRELEQARSAHANAKADVRSAASAVVASLIEEQSDELRRIEESAATLRTTLRAALEYWPSASGPIGLNQQVANFIAQEPVYSVPEVAGISGRQAATERRQAPYKDYFTRLCTDADAVFAE
jgi:hypothetical protein